MEQHSLPQPGFCCNRCFGLQLTSIDVLLAGKLAIAEASLDVEQAGLPVGPGRPHLGRGGHGSSAALTDATRTERVGSAIIRVVPSIAVLSSALPLLPAAHVAVPLLLHADQARSWDLAPVSGVHHQHMSVLLRGCGSGGRGAAWPT